MRFIKGFIVGGLIIGGLAFAAGYNYGRGAPIVSNPFGEPTLGEQVQEMGEETRDATQRLLDKATGN
jgi:hypothetical protein